MYIGTIQKIHSDLAKNKEIIEANNQMKGLPLHKRWEIAEKKVFESGLINKYVEEPDELEEAEIKQVYSTLFPEFNVLEILGLNSMSCLRQDEREEAENHVPLVINFKNPQNLGLQDDNGIVSVITIPYYIQEHYVQKYLSEQKEKLEKSGEEWDLDDLLKTLPFHYVDDYYWQSVFL